MNIDSFYFINIPGITANYFSVHIIPNVCLHIL